MPDPTDPRPDAPPDPAAEARALRSAWLELIGLIARRLAHARPEPRTQEDPGARDREDRSS